MNFGEIKLKELYFAGFKPSIHDIIETESEILSLEASLIDDEEKKIFSKIK